MEATVTNLFDAEKEPARRRPMVRVRVHNPDCNQLALFTNVITRGWAEILCYEDQVPALNALVETRLDMLEVAEKAHQMALAEETMDHVEGFSGTVEDMAALIEAGTNANVMEAYEKASAASPSSPYGKFRDLVKRDVLPLRSVEVVQEGIPEPQQERSDAELDRVTAVLSKATGSGKGDVNKALAKQVKDQAKQIEALMAKLTELEEAATSPKE